MPRALIQCLFFVVWLVHLDADVYRDRPRIKTNDGHLIFQPATDKNIYLQTNGPKSAIFVGGVNVLNINITGRDNIQPQSYPDISTYLNGPGGILDRLTRLENRPVERNTFNRTLWRRVNGLRARIIALETRIQNMVKDECTSHPCLHGGTCLNLANGYHCLCPNNWEGKDCDEDVNECRIYQGTDLGCQNRANCKNTPGSYECECMPGWYGIHCTKRRKDCSGGEFEMCGHGTCVPTSTGEGIKCICDQGWTTNGTGDACLTDVNECESNYGPRCSVNPRVECINLPGSFRCGQCPSGYEGDGYICSDIDECMTNNGGCSISPKVTCHNTVGSRICAPCPTGYQGDGVTCTWRGSCSINRGGCHPSAQCIDNAAVGGQLAQCICPQGMEGDGIGLHGCYVSTDNFTRGCDSNPCGIHGQCHPLRSGYTCFCYRGYGGMHCDAAHDYCSSRPCLNGGVCKADESSSRGFRCECTARYTGDLCHVPASTCGGYLRAEEGSIVYPLSNTTYENNVRCAWVINIDSNKVINVTFSKFNLEPGNHEGTNEDCKFDFLQIHDGYSSSSQIIGRFCGNEFPKGGNIISSHNYLYFWFRSDSTIVSDGFALHWTSIDPVCGGEIDATVHGRISSPGSPGKYPPNRDCYWHLTTTYGKRIQLHFFSLDIETHSNCSFDFVEIYDGALTTDLLIGRYCNSSTPAPVTSGGSDMLVHFHSDAYGAGYGFQAAFSPADGVPGCGGLHTSDRGEISSPSFDGKYLSGMTCEYQIRTNPGTKIRINFKLFNLEVSRACKYDYLKVYDGPNENSPLVGRFCGRSFPKSYTSSTNQMFFRFRSDASISGEGFRINYESVCQQVIQGDSGYITSPGYPLSYPANRVCEYFIGTSPGKAIELTFQDFDIEDNNYFSCQYDYVEVRDGVDVNATLLGKYCGGNDHFPPTQTSTHNYMYVRFNSDMSISGSGFYANYTTIDVECGGIYRESNGTISHLYSNNQHCTWMIVAPEGMGIKLTWNRFSLESMPSCSADYVTLTEIDENNENIDLGKYCGTNLPPAITTSTNKLKIYFKSDISIQLDGFSVSYEFLDERTHCGGNFTKTHGTIYSPGWPKRYPANRDYSYGTAKGFKANFTVICGATIIATYNGIIENDKWHANHVLDNNCTWTILAPSEDQKISLTITFISIPKDTEVITNRKCPLSFLRVLDGSNAEAPLIDEYCGRKVPPMIVSRGSAVTIIFGAYNGTAQGQFSAHYSPIMSTCGGVLTSEEGSIASPNYPESYPINSSCEWILSTSPGNKVYITFEQFNLKLSENCNEDYLEVRENSASGTLLGVYCGSEIPANTSTATQLYIKFQSSSENSGQGFVLHYGFLHGNVISGLESGDIASPLYPRFFEGAGEFSWRVSTEAESISAVLVRAEIPSYSTECSNSLTFYDGYDEQAPVLENFCGLLKTEKEIKTSTNMLFIQLKLDESNTGSIFYLRWAKSDSSLDTSDTSTRPNCGLNETKTLTPGQKITIKSPGYPNEYRNDLNCEWVFRAAPGQHVNLHFNTFHLEETETCFADFVSIYSSNTPAVWKPVKEKFCLSQDTKEDFNASNYMKIVFSTDSSITHTGFEAKVSSFCGGFINDLSGIIEPRYEDFDIMTPKNCEWVLKVRPGRQIKLNFEHFNITNPESQCTTFVTIRNGDSVEAPMLGTGRYCGFEHEKREDLESSGNAVFVKFHPGYFAGMRRFTNFRLHYEEKGVECGGTVTLDNSNNWKVFNSPNYPNVPTPYSECVWIFKGPPGEILRIDFLERFDLQPSEDCHVEFVEIRDGSTDIAPLKGRYCGTSPSTVKTDNNNVYIKYYTQLAEPRNGFKANVSIDVCGGTIRANKGEVTSPGFPHFPPLPSYTKCEWRIIASQRLTLLIKPQDIDLPSSKHNHLCETKITIEELEGTNSTTLKTFCASPFEDYDMTSVQTATNEVVIRLEIGDYSEYGSTSRGFRFSFNSSIPSCGGDVSTPEGYLTTTGYPRETSIRYCQWRITVPNKNRRVRLLLLDSNVEKHRIGIYNDLHFQSLIKTLPSTDETEVAHVYESTGNTMSVYLWLDSVAMRHRFKAKFSSDESSLCGGELHALQGELTSPNLDRAYICEWKYTPNLPADISNLTTYNTLFVNAKVNTSSAGTRQYCTYSEPKLIISTSSRGHYSSKRLCGNSEKSLTLPVPEMKLTASNDKRSSLYFHVEWKLNPCGGTIEVSGEPVNILNVPNDYNETLNCAWIVSVPIDTRVELKLEGSFETDCNKETVYIRQGYDYDDGPNIADYCKDKRQDSPLQLPYTQILVYYHSELKGKSNVRLMAKTATDLCGGILTDYQRVFESPNYPKSYAPNLECSWEIRSEIGNRISLSFLETFRIEERTNCSKDAVIIYDWKDKSWVQMARLCGRSLPPSYNSTGQRMKVVLRTDADIQMDGFRARWDTICGGTFNATHTEQFLYSPSEMGGANYPPNQDCTYSIFGGGNKIFMKFLEFSLEGSYPNCEYDNLTVRSYSFDEYYEDYTYCSSERPSIPPTSKRIDLIFRTDSYIQRKGFKVMYQIDSCGGKIDKPTVINSNPNTEEYQNDENCTWIVEAPKNKVVVIKFQYIFIESSRDCRDDHVSVFDSNRIEQEKRIALFCGNINKTIVLRSTSNNMVVQFESDVYIGLKGFKADIFFTYSPAAGCGGEIDLTTLSLGATKSLNSPLFNGMTVYENFLNCQWRIKAPMDYAIKIKFTQFHIAPCDGVNQTAIGFSKCDCDYVEILDGVNPHDLVIGTYCGHNIPDRQEFISSKNIMSVTLHTDGEIVSAGFKAELSVQRQVCGQTHYLVGFSEQTIRSPGYATGKVPTGLHCVYRIDASSEDYTTLHLKIKTLDLRSGNLDANQCNKDKLLIVNSPKAMNATLGSDYIMHANNDLFSSSRYYYYNDEIALKTDQLEYCGVKSNIDLYLKGSVSVYLQTSPEADPIKHKGIELEVSYLRFCGRNYTELQGWLTTDDHHQTDTNAEECNTLISVPENYTISLYFMKVRTSYMLDETKAFFEVFDGNTTASAKLHRFTDYDEPKALFSTGRYVLLHNKPHLGHYFNYELFYTATDKGRGCGGKLQNVVGMVMSPMYPGRYQKQGSCEWELETPSNTHLELIFTAFDFGRACDTNYLQLVDRSGIVISTYCEEVPAKYTSTDNYVKIVYTTDNHNIGTGWVAEFNAVR
ncbi:CUB domain-containing protein [Phthorimaea operculella]|nr:CUB domain-containing protein [Phthorimaea operculella]